MKSRLLFIFAILLLMPLVSSEIFINQINSNYNAGDSFSAQINLIPNTATADHVHVDMVCGDLSTNIFNQFFSLDAGHEQSLTPSTQISASYFRIVNVSLENVTETNNETNKTKTVQKNVEKITNFYDCHLSVSYGPESQDSNIFSISQEIESDLELDFDTYKPGDNVKLKGIANRHSGNLIQGFAEVFIDTLGVYASGAVNNGNLDLTFPIPEKAKSGEQLLRLRVYETDIHGDVINEGFKEISLEITQVLKDLKIFFDSESVNPGDKFNFNVNTYDQAGDIIQEDISIIVYDPNDNVFLKKLIKPESKQEVTLSLDDIPGYWRVEASTQGISKRKLFYLQEKPLIQTSLVGDTLVVTNVGNVQYEGPLEVTIGSNVEVKQISLKVGESTNFRLKAPDGDYQISINDGSETSILGNTYLTGNSIKVLDFGESLTDIVGNPSVWWLILIAFIIVFSYVYFKKKIAESKLNSPVSNKVVESKPSSDIMDGTKEEAYIIAVKSKSEKDSSYVDETITDALNYAKGSGAKVYIDAEYKIIVLSKKLTGREDNAVNSIKIAKRLEEILLEHNKKYKEKITFGIGVNEGYIISERSNNQFRFSSIGNLISKAKRIANEESMNVLVSDSMHRKVQGTIKMIKKGSNYEIGRINDRAKYKDFLKGFKS